MIVCGGREGGGGERRAEGMLLQKVRSLTLYNGTIMILQVV